MQLLYTNCVSIISYACEVKCYSSRDMSLCNTAINNAIRKIFTFHRWESIRSLREGLGYKSIYVIFARAERKFKKSLKCSRNNIVSHLATVFKIE